MLDLATFALEVSLCFRVVTSYTSTLRHGRILWRECSADHELRRPVLFSQKPAERRHCPTELLSNNRALKVPKVLHLNMVEQLLRLGNSKLNARFGHVNPQGILYDIVHVRMHALPLYVIIPKAEQRCSGMQDTSQTELM